MIACCVGTGAGEGRDVRRGHGEAIPGDEGSRLRHKKATETVQPMTAIAKNATTPITQ
jgi:hypothetical protein